MKTYKQFINEALSVETKNIANPTDWIIKAKTAAGEEYVVKNTKFPKLYDIDSAKTPQDKNIAAAGFMEYNIIPEERTGLICTRDLLKALKPVIAGDEEDYENGVGFSIGNPLSQERMHEIVGYFKDRFTKCRKRDSAYAKQIKEGEAPVEVITKVQKGKPEEIWFVPVWGGTMPVAEDDVLIYNENEVYRIARAEFNQTYQL